MYIVFTDTELETLTDEQKAKLTSGDDGDDPRTLDTSDLREAAQVIGIDWTDLIPDEMEGENIVGLKKALARERKTARENEHDLKAARKRLGDGDSVKDGEIEKLKTRLAERDETITGLETDIKTTSQDAKISETVSKHKGDLDLLKPHLRSRLEENPEADLDEIMPDLKDKHPGAFQSSTHSGTGADPNRGSDSRTIGITSHPMRRSEMTDKQKNDYQKKHGLDALLDLPT